MEQGVSPFESSVNLQGNETDIKQETSSSMFESSVNLQGNETGAI